MVLQVAGNVGPIGISSSPTWFSIKDNGRAIRCELDTGMVGNIYFAGKNKKSSIKIDLAVSDSPLDGLRPEADSSVYNAHRPADLTAPSGKNAQDKVFIAAGMFN